MDNLSMAVEMCNVKPFFFLIGHPFSMPLPVKSQAEIKTLVEEMKRTKKDAKTICAANPAIEDSTKNKKLNKEKRYSCSAANTHRHIHEGK